MDFLLLINWMNRQYVKGGNMAKDEEEIKESAEEIVDSFSEIVEDLPTEKETYYIQDIFNVLRSDGESTSEEELGQFRENFLKVVPEADQEGNLKVEVAKWKE